MDERGGGALDGGEPGSRHFLRADRTLVLRALTPVVAAAAIAPLIPGEMAVHRLAALCFLLGCATVVLAPLSGTSEKAASRSAAAAAGIAASIALPSVLLDEPVGAGLAAGGALAGFFVLLSGAASVTSRASGAKAAGVVVACCLGAACLASFHIGDPVLEWGGSGSPSHGAISLLHLVNPMGGAVGDALGLDWLRMSIMYSGFPGTAKDGLSAAQYYAWSYPAWWTTALLHGGVGAALLAVGRSGFRLPLRTAQL